MIPAGPVSEDFVRQIGFGRSMFAMFAPLVFHGEGHGGQDDPHRGLLGFGSHDEVSDRLDRDVRREDE